MLFRSAQTYNDAVTLGAGTTLTTTDSAVTFVSTLNNAQALTISTGSGAITSKHINLPRKELDWIIKIYTKRITLKRQARNDSNILNSKCLDRIFPMSKEKYIDFIHKIKYLEEFSKACICVLYFFNIYKKSCGSIKLDSNNEKQYVSIRVYPYSKKSFNAYRTGISKVGVRV